MPPTAPHRGRGSEVVIISSPTVQSCRAFVHVLRMQARACLGYTQRTLDGHYNMDVPAPYDEIRGEEYEEYDEARRQRDLFAMGGMSTKSEHMPLATESLLYKRRGRGAGHQRLDLDPSAQRPPHTHTGRCPGARTLLSQRRPVAPPSNKPCVHIIAQG